QERCLRTRILRRLAVIVSVSHDGQGHGDLRRLTAMAALGEIAIDRVQGAGRDLSRLAILKGIIEPRYPFRMFGEKLSRRLIALLIPDDYHPSLGGRGSGAIFTLVDLSDRTVDVVVPAGTHPVVVVPRVVKVVNPRASAQYTHVALFE